MAIERSNPSTLADMSGYSRVVKDGTTVYVAGQLSRNSAGEPSARVILKPKPCRRSRTSKRRWSQPAAT
jgi:hypothetical protein